MFWFIAIQIACWIAFIWVMARTTNIDKRVSNIEQNWGRFQKRRRDVREALMGTRRVVKKEPRNNNDKRDNNSNDNGIRITQGVL